MSILTKYFADSAFVRLKPHLKDGAIRLVEQVLGLLDADGKAGVDQVLAALFPMAQTASANAQLSRLRSEIKRAAGDHDIPLQLNITKDKRAGAKNRWVWFDGGITGSP